LINEQGSGGLGEVLLHTVGSFDLTLYTTEVDKVIIAQDGLKRLINDLSPGAYVTLTQVDFKILDSLAIRPIGVYGDRFEIIKFLSSLKVLDEHT
jgi:hypothetical protein